MISLLLLCAILLKVVNGKSLRHQSADDDANDNNDDWNWNAVESGRRGGMRMARILNIPVSCPPDQKFVAHRCRKIITR